MTDGFETLGDWEGLASYKAALVLLKDHHGRVLLQFRDNFPHVKSGGKWGCFGGEIEAGETAHDAVVRETAEEIGVAIPAEAFRPFVRILSTTQEGHQHYVFICEQPVAPAEITLEEGAGFAFITQEQCDQFDIIPSVRQVLDHYFSTQTCEYIQ